MKLISRIVLGAVALFILAAVGANFLTRRPIDSARFAEPPIAAAPPVSTTDVRFSILPTATFSAPEGAVFEGGNWFERRAMAHSAVLICHPRGFVLFDTGLGRAIDSQFEEFPPTTRAALGAYEKRASAADVIAEASPCPDRPLIVIPSHLHWDHAGGIEDLPLSQVWVAPEELQQARAAGVRQGFLPGQIDAQTIHWRPLNLTGGPYEQYDRSLDVFGDGSLVLVPMSGHTAGSVGLFITAAGGRYFLTGDTTWAVEGFTRPAHKFFAARSMADLDLAQLDAEIAGVRRLIRRDPTLTVIPAHDVVAYPTDGVYPNWIGD
ncbi:MAG: MBL fold metallo-hydrolase [Hyphomonadaceae bacterium]|nr:MBL fold metallo-hydrolase [Hyphomonadaceae bacterium]